jgi:anti-anti-sigma factor
MSCPSDSRPELLIHAESRLGASDVLIRVSGEIDLASSPALERRLGEFISRGARTVVVDLRDVEFCDVTTVNALLRVEAELRAADGRLRLLGPCPWMSRMLSVLALQHRLQLEQPADAAGAAG